MESTWIAGVWKQTEICKLRSSAYGPPRPLLFVRYPVILQVLFPLVLRTVPAAIGTGCLALVKPPALPEHKYKRCLHLSAC